MSSSSKLEAASLPNLGRLWTQIRWQILFLLFAITVVNFIDRQTLSVIAPVLTQKFHMSNTDYGRVVSAFMLGMMVGEFPMGWIMDRVGVRVGLSLAVLWWSIGTGLQSIGQSVLQFGLFRFWMGTGECGNFSGGMKIVSEWFPERERALAVGIFNSGGMLGAAIAPPCIVFLTLHFGWRTAFAVPALLGGIWILLWLLIYAPLRSHPRVRDSEGSYILAGAGKSLPVPSNRELLSRKDVWGLMLLRSLVGPVVQFYWFWTPQYLFHARGLSLAEIGSLAWIPFLFGDIGGITGGWTAGFMLRHGFSLNTARLTTMYAGAACCLLSIGVVLTGGLFMAITLLSVVLFGNAFVSANMFAAIPDLVPKAAVGRVTGLTGIAGGFSGLLFPLLSGYLIDRVSYVPVFFIAALMPLAGVLLIHRIVGRIQSSSA